MLLSKVLDGLTLVRQSLSADPDVNGVVYDSRQVKPGNLFVALRGNHTDGHAHVQDAVQRGAVAVLVEEPVEVNADWAQVSETLPALATVSQRVYGYPDTDLLLVGVTGSNGKSTVTYLIEAIAHAASQKVGLLGTIEYRWPGYHRAATHTTPLASDLFDALAAMKQAGVQQVAMEVSSHALAMHRVDALEFDVGVFTNLSHEHLDYHGTMDQYAATKFKLFSEHLKPGGRRAVINLDDTWGASWIRRLGPGRCLTYGFSHRADIYPENYDLRADGIDAVLRTPAGRLTLETPLLGRHNLCNVLSAVGAALASGLSLGDVEQGLLNPTLVPGRLEPVVCGQPFQVLVDYAHTPDGVRQVLSTLVEVPHRRLICVVGAGGDRDRKKRPLMARIAQELADVVILTSDNPRTEDPEKIIDEMETGMVGGVGATYQRQSDRRTAIAQAIEQAGDGDILLIAGKGHEDYQEVQGVRHPFDDRVIAREFLAEAGFGFARQ